ncbi:MAG: hypothetical protein WKF38_04470, partial [Candidatus Limnocylindrales bacterium]
MAVSQVKPVAAGGMVEGMGEADGGTPDVACGVATGADGEAAGPGLVAGEADGAALPDAPG